VDRREPAGPHAGCLNRSSADPSEGVELRWSCELKTVTSGWLAASSRSRAWLASKVSQSMATLRSNARMNPGTWPGGTLASPWWK